jgi:hypothetical protein
MYHRVPIKDCRAMEDGILSPGSDFDTHPLTVQ